MDDRNLGSSQQAEVHIASELLPMSNWAEIKNIVPCRKLMTAFPLNVPSLWKVALPRPKLPALLYKNTVVLNFHKGSCSFIILNKFLSKGEFQQ